MGVGASGVNDIVECDNPEVKLGNIDEKMNATDHCPEILQIADSGGKLIVVSDKNEYRNVGDIFSVT